MDASEVVEAVDIVEYISQYIDLEQKGREYWGLSCFTDEKTPSFSVDPVKRVYCDFSSGRRGNLVQFVIDHDGVSVPEAIRILKRYAHIEDTDESNGTVTRLEATKVAKKYRDKVRRPQKMTAKPMPQDCMSQYEFRRDKLQTWADEGISWQTMRRFGVRYDAFDDRIVYPITDCDGNIVSVCGRTCDPDFKEKKIRKYTYLKQIGSLDTIYAFSLNREFILSSREIILFEGAKSCMKAWDWGIRNTGALLTSHLSIHQLKFLIKLSNFHRVRIVFALDSDIDISQDDNIRKLCSYARVEWVKNRDDVLSAKDSPTDRGRQIFENLYSRRERCEFTPNRRAEKACG